MAMDCSFSFGPNRSYFLRVGGDNYAYSDEPNAPPAGLLRVITDAEYPQVSSQMFDVAVAMEPEVWCMSWDTAEKGRFYEYQYLGDNYARLSRFMQRACGVAGGRMTLTTFGPNHSYFAIAPKGCSWQNIPGGLEEDVTACMIKLHPAAVALGINASYLVVYSDGTITHDLRGEYPLLEALIKEAPNKGGLKYVALNPFVAGEYYAVCGDGSASWNFPTAWAKDVGDVSRDLAARLVSAGGTAVSTGGTAPAPAPPVQPQPQVQPAPVQQPAPQPVQQQQQRAVQQPAQQQNANQQQQHFPPPKQNESHAQEKHKHGGINWGKFAGDFLKGMEDGFAKANGGGEGGEQQQQQRPHPQPHPQYRPNLGWQQQQQQQQMFVQPVYVPPPMFEEVVVQETVVNTGAGLQTTVVETEVFY